MPTYQWYCPDHPDKIVETVSSYSNRKAPECEKCSKKMEITITEMPGVHNADSGLTKHKHKYGNNLPNDYKFDSGSGASFG